MQTGNVVFGPTHIGEWAKYQGWQPLPYDPRTHPDWWKWQRAIQDPQGYRIEQLEMEVKRLKARIAELEAPPYHGEWAAG